MVPITCIWGFHFEVHKEGGNHLLSPWEDVLQKVLGRRGLISYCFGTITFSYDHPISLAKRNVQDGHGDLCNEHIIVVLIMGTKPKGTNLHKRFSNRPSLSFLTERLTCRSNDRGV